MLLYRPTNPSLFPQSDRGTSARHIESVPEVNMTYPVAMVIGSEKLLALNFFLRREDYLNPIFSRTGYYFDYFSLLIFRNE